MQELQSKQVRVQRQVKLPIVYKGHVLDEKLKLDMLVQDEIIIELKSVDSILPVHKAQLLTYLKLKNK
jgi:GxxExxY protein